MKNKVVPNWAIKNLKHFFVGIISIFIAYSCNNEQESSQTKAEWKSLFNGKDLNGWKVKIAGHDLGDNFGNTFRVEDELLKISYDQYDSLNGKFGLLISEKEYSHYKFKVEYRFIGEQVAGSPPWAVLASGVMFHCQSGTSISKDQQFPLCVEAQICGGNGVDEWPTGNVVTPGTHIEMDGAVITEHIIKSNSKTFHGDQWVTMEIEVHGADSVKHFVNGELVVKYEKLQLDTADNITKKIIQEKGNPGLSSGHIAIQAEGHDMEFKNIEIMILEP